MGNVIEIKNLTHYYKSKKIYENLNFDVQGGKIFGLLGRNGVGKTTLIKILMGFLKPVSGECRVFGEKSHKMNPVVRKRIGLLFEGHLAYEFMTIGQIERFYGDFYENWDRSIYYDLVGKLGLKDDHLIKNMSCGQRSQVVLGLLFAQQPDLMILDDYSMGLDAGYRYLFIDYLKEYVKKPGKTVFMTSHVMTDLEDMVDDVIFLDRKRELLKISLNEFMSSFKKFSFKLNSENNLPQKDEIIENIDISGGQISVFSFAEKDRVLEHLEKFGVKSSIEEEKMNLEQAFVGLTGKY
ncbi:MAG: methyltransferase [Deltaproteobacteria bacterium]|nr:MAG: methyltransferase [Deltaproteobacteria bacterium]